MNELALSWRRKSMKTKDLRKQGGGWGSAPFAQPCSQPVRQASVENSRLRQVHVVRNAAEGHRHLRIVIDGERRPPVAVPRLPDRTGIDHVAAVRAQRQLDLLRLVTGIVVRR